MNKNKMPRFIVTLTYYQWTCGDGCCSDSGYKIRVDDGNKCLWMDNDWDMNWDGDVLLESAIERMSVKVGRKVLENIDFIVDKCDDYIDGKC